MTCELDSFGSHANRTLSTALLAPILRLCVSHPSALQFSKHNSGGRRFNIHTTLQIVLNCETPTSCLMVNPHLGGPAEVNTVCKYSEIGLSSVSGLSVGPDQVDSHVVAGITANHTVL